MSIKRLANLVNLLLIVQICSQGEYQSLCFVVKDIIMQRKQNTNAKEEKKMANEKNTKKTEGQDNIEKPLFTGDYWRDTAVTEFEKAAEASNAIFNAIKNKLSRRKKNSKESWRICQPSKIASEETKKRLWKSFSEPRWYWNFIIARNPDFANIKNETFAKRLRIFRCYVSFQIHNSN